MIFAPNNLLVTKIYKLDGYIAPNDSTYIYIYIYRERERERERERFI